VLERIADMTVKINDQRVRPRDQRLAETECGPAHGGGVCSHFGQQRTVPEKPRCGLVLLIAWRLLPTDAGVRTFTKRRAIRNPRIPAQADPVSIFFWVHTVAMHTVIDFLWLFSLTRP